MHTMKLEPILLGSSVLLLPRVLGIMSLLMKSARVLRTNALQLTTKATCCFCDFLGTGTAGFCAEAERGGWVQVKQDLIVIT